MLQWTPEAREAAMRAQAEYDDDIVEATIQRAEEIATTNGYTVVDTDVWFSALLDVRLPWLDEQKRSA